MASDLDKLSFFQPELPRHLVEGIEIEVYGPIISEKVPYYSV